MTGLDISNRDEGLRHKVVVTFGRFRLSTSSLLVLLRLKHPRAAGEAKRAAQAQSKPTNVTFRVDRDRLVDVFRKSVILADSSTNGVGRRRLIATGLLCGDLQRE
jgi:hypothetical protein